MNSCQQVFLAACTLLVICSASHAAQADTHNPLERIRPVRSVQLEPSVSISVNATTLSHSGQWFEVAWTVDTPSFTDWIAVWVPASANFSETGPAKYKLAPQCPTHMTDGKGKLSFHLVNYRQDMVFAFMRGGLLQPVVAALSPVIHVANPNEPLQGHLALTGDNTQMLVQWTTHNSSRPVVKYGERSGQYTRTAEASTITYTRAEMCGIPATTLGWVDPGMLHAAKLTGLQPGKRYYYVFGDEAWGFSSEASFRAAPPVGPHTTVKLLAVADMGQGEEDGSMEQSEMLPSLNTTRLMRQEGDDYQLLVHNGDISYARGYVTQWDNFMHQIEPLVRRMPYMVAPGNHERDWPGSGDRYNNNYDSGGECGVAYERRMQMPLPGPDRQWYSFDFGPIHFLQYSTEHDFAPGSEQYTFIEYDLASVDRSKTPWVILGGHRPMYISSNNMMPVDGDQPVAEALRKALEGLLHTYKVDMVWQGHHHSYQRSCPVLNQTCQRRGVFGASAGGPVQLVIGNAGADLSLNTPLWPNAVWQKIKLWWGYLRVEASGTRLKCQMISNADGSVMDEVVLTKPRSWGDNYMAARRVPQEQAQQGQLWRWRQQHRLGVLLDGEREAAAVS